MSAYTKRKHVSKEIEEFDDLPTDKSIAKIISGKGNNLHLVKADNGDEYLASMPTKFRKHVWIKRGDFVLVEPIEEGDKVKAEISHVLLKFHIKQLKKEGKWPKIFDEEENADKESKTIDDNADHSNDNIDENIDDDSIDEEYDSSDSSLEENPNHANDLEDEESESSDDDEANLAESKQ